MKRTLKKAVAGLLALMLAAGIIDCGAENQTQPEETKAPEVIQVQPKKEKCTDLGTPLADVRVRQALALAIDMDTVIEALFHENAEKTDSFAGIARFWECDPELAKELLAEAGWPTEYVLDVVYTGDAQTEDLLSAIGICWEAIGVRAEFRKLEGDVEAQLWAAPEDPKEDDAAVDWDLALCTLMPLTSWDSYSSFASDSPRNSHTPPQEGLDDLIEQAASADESQRKAAVAAVQQILTEQVPAIGLMQQNVFFYTSNHLSGAEHAAGNDRYVYTKDILNWTTDREDETLYTNGGPVNFYVTPLAEPGQYLYQELVFERLLHADGDLNPSDGMLAENYHLSEDGLQLEFVLRDDLTWQDGEPLTAEDVKFTFELYLQANDANPVLKAVLDALEGAVDFRSGITEDCSGILVEENRITFRFATAAPDALTVFSQWPVLPKHCLEKADPENLQKDSFWKAPIGSGPYRVAETVMGEYAVLEHWEDYRISGEGNIRRIYLAASGETDADLVLRADMDMLDLGWGISADDAWAMDRMEGMKVTVLKIPCIRCFFINQFPHESYLAQTEND